MPKKDDEFLLHPLSDGEEPLCPGCQRPMELSNYEARGLSPAPDFVTFVCPACGRSERLLVEQPLGK